jgi:hypothetical protein
MVPVLEVVVTEENPAAPGVPEVARLLAGVLGRTSEVGRPIGCGCTKAVAIVEVADVRTVAAMLVMGNGPMGLF